MANYVIFYVHDNYDGRASQVPIGEYPTLKDLSAFGIVNDDVSSVRIPQGLKVIMYKDINFGGRSVELVADTPSLRPYSFNDEMSSFKVVAMGTGSTTGGGTTATPGGGTTATPGAKKKISTVGWVLIGVGSLVLIGGGIFLSLKLIKK